MVCNAVNVWHIEQRSCDPKDQVSCCGSVEKGRKLVAQAKQVYALMDPRRPAVIRYVGCSQRLPVRVYEHVYAATHKTGHNLRAKDEWIRGLLAEGVTPQFVVLETVTEDEAWRNREEFWIRVHRTPELTNPPSRPPGKPATDEDRSRGWHGWKFW